VKRIALAVLLSTCAACASHAQTAVTLGKVVTISGAESGNPEKVWAYVDPSDPRYLMACGWFDDPQDALLAGYVYTSSDGGSSWHRTLLEDSTKFVSEEACTYGSHGDAYFSAGASNYYDGWPHHETGHLLVYASHDHGLTWRHVFTRRQGWVDWTYLADVPGSGADPSSLVIFGNSATDRLGHWLASRPIAIVSSDGGKTFTAPISPNKAWGGKQFTYGGVFAGDADVLANGTTLFAASTWMMPHSQAAWATAPTEQMPEAAEIFAYSPKLHTLRSRAVLGKARGRWIFLNELAQDRSNGTYRGRLYDAWLDGGRVISTLWFATSTDSGATWTSRPVAHGSGGFSLGRCGKYDHLDQLALAVNSQGIVGLTWLANYSKVYFADSRDGGKTFGDATLVAQIDPGAARETTVEAITWDDYWLDAILSTMAGKPNPQTAWLKTLGLGVVMQPSIMYDIALAADPAGAFHAFWIAPWQNARRVWTRTITVNTNAGQIALKSPEKSQVWLACKSLNTAGVHPALPSRSNPVHVPSGFADVTQSIALDPIRYHYSPVNHEVTIDTVVTNNGHATLRAPLTLVGIGLHSDFGASSSALNATSRIDGQPAWDISSAIPAGGLKPKTRSKPIHVAFLITHFRSLPSNYLGGDAVAMGIRAYEGKP
jgi:hypothetical protein